MVKLYPSQLTWCENGVNAAASPSHCWRYIKLTRDLPKTEIHPLYKAIGEANEVQHMENLTAAGKAFEREVPWQFHTDDYTLSGRCDFKLSDSVDECKATLKVLNQRDLPKDEHVFQLCVYLGYFELSHGRLIYGRYQRNKQEELVRTAVEIVPVTIEDSGAIKVGELDTGHNMDRILEPAAGLAAVLKSDDIPQRPIEKGWNGSCKYCPLSGACNNYDHGELSADELKAAVPTLLENHQQKEPHITTIRGSKNGRL